MKTSETTAALKVALADRYRPPEWAFFGELRNGTGGAHKRTADGFAMNCYPSRGLELHGFEIKASDSDLQSEIRDGSKADALGRYMDFWWLVTTPEIYGRQRLLIPDPWGVLKLQPAGKLVIAAKPRKIDCEPMPRSLIASLLRRRVEDEEKAIRVARDDGWSDGYRAGQKAGARDAKGEKELRSWKLAHREIKSKVDAFEEASGLTIVNWEAGKLGAAARELIDNRKALDSSRVQLERLHRMVSAAHGASLGRASA